MSAGGREKKSTSWTRRITAAGSTGPSTCPRLRRTGTRALHDAPWPCRLRGWTAVLSLALGAGGAVRRSGMVSPMRCGSATRMSGDRTSDAPAVGLLMRLLAGEALTPRGSPTAASPPFALWGRRPARRLQAPPAPGGGRAGWTTALDRRAGQAEGGRSPRRVAGAPRMPPGAAIEQKRPRPRAGPGVGPQPEPNAAPPTARAGDGCLTCLRATMPPHGPSAQGRGRRSRPRRSRSDGRRACPWAVWRGPGQGRRGP